MKGSEGYSVGLTCMEFCGMSSKNIFRPYRLPGTGSLMP
jgi:hypothetical protein